MPHEITKIKFSAEEIDHWWIGDEKWITDDKNVQRRSWSNYQLKRQSFTQSTLTKLAALQLHGYKIVDSKLNICFSSSGAVRQAIRNRLRETKTFRGNGAGQDHNKMRLNAVCFYPKTLESGQLLTAAPVTRFNVTLRLYEARELPNSGLRSSWFRTSKTIDNDASNETAVYERSCS